MVIINLWGAPSCGKSTTAAGLFFLMKINKEKVELVNEFAKELVWEERFNIFGEQMFILGEQGRRLSRLDGKIDYVITDSPLPLTCYYQPKGYYKSFDDICWEMFNSYENINIFLKREHDFETFGRRHNEEEAKEIEQDLLRFMKRHGVSYVEIIANPKTPENLYNYINSLKPRKLEMPFDLDNK